MGRTSVGVLLLGLILSGCSKNSSTTTPTSTTDTTTGAVTVTDVQVAGGPVLTGLRVRSQLTATAIKSDGTTADVTLLSTWLSSDPTVAAISPAGVVTTIGAGGTHITAAYSGVIGSVDLGVRPITTTFAGPVTDSTGQRGTFTITIQSSVDPAPTTTDADVTGSMQVGNQPAIQLRGDFSESSGVLYLSTSDAPLRFTANVAGGSVNGSYTDPNGVTGTFVSTSMTTR